MSDRGYWRGDDVKLGPMPEPPEPPPPPSSARAGWAQVVNVDIEAIPIEPAPLMIKITISGGLSGSAVGNVRKNGEVLARQIEERLGFPVPVVVCRPGFDIEVVRDPRSEEP